MRRGKGEEGNGAEDELAREEGKKRSESSFGYRVPWQMRERKKGSGKRNDGMMGPLGALVPHVLSSYGNGS